MQKFLDFISSKVFRNVVCFILFTGLMTAAISSQNFFFQKIIENNIALKDVIAEKDIKVIDTIKTEQHKKEVAQNTKETKLRLSLKKQQPHLLFMPQQQLPRLLLFLTLQEREFP